jgi:hypothetical protein
MLDSPIEVYKSECREILRRFLAHKIGFTSCIAALEDAPADVMPRLTPDEIVELRQFALANNGVVMDEMARRSATQHP